LGQKFKSWSLIITPDWFAKFPFLENTENYFIKGTFDFFDLLSIAAGTVVAYFTLLISSKRRNVDEKTI